MKLELVDVDTVVAGSAVEVGTVETLVPGSAVEVGTVDTDIQVQLLKLEP